MKKRGMWFDLVSRICLVALVLALLQNAQGTGATQWAAKQEGMSYAAWWSGDYVDADADVALAHLKETGCEWVSLIVTGYQSTIDATAIYTNTATPTDADLVHVIRWAHEQQPPLKVMLKPHLDLSSDPEHWRGDIGEGFSEAQWAEWFSSYRTFIVHYADLAQDNDIEQFCIGTELEGTSHRATEWRAVVSAVRARYGGLITYAANHGGEKIEQGEVMEIAWWDALDYIGLDAYYPLADKNAPTFSELKAKWCAIASVLADLSSREGKQILFTEIGYRSIDGAVQRPWDWQSEGAVDLQEQADAYRATLECVWHSDWFGGMYWWVWSTDPFAGAACDDSYTPHDKPAEDVLRTWYGAAARRSPTSGPYPDPREPLVIYNDDLAPGWQDWSWDAACDLASTDQVFSGSRAISVTLDPWGGLSLWHDAWEPTPYLWLEFFIRAASPSVALWAFLYDGDGNELRRRPVDDCRYIEGGAIEPGTWRLVRIPLADLQASGKDLTRIAIQERSGASNTAFWIDEMRLVRGHWPTHLPLVLRH
jgi:hypothetical protein